jgi:23S rRNA (adenine-N6)-dimethyltransferase
VSERSRHSARWGWHQLDERWAARLVALAQVGPGDLVLDVGAGHGTITAALARAGARVVAIELHERRVATLRERFDGCQVTVVHADATDL